MDIAGYFHLPSGIFLNLIKISIPPMGRTGALARMVDHCQVRRMVGNKAKTAIPVHQRTSIR